MVAEVRKVFTFEGMFPEGGYSGNFWSDAHKYPVS